MKCDGIRMGMAAAMILCGLAASADEAAVEGPWRVDFPPGRGTPASVTMRVLVPWKDAFDASNKGGRSAWARAFSGTAVYSAKFVFHPGGGRVTLDMGRVCESAKVRLNGTEVGSFDKAPFVADVTRAVKDGINELEIEIKGSPVNQRIFDANVPLSERAVKRGPLPDPSTPYVDSGLLGPVKLVFSAGTFVARDRK